MASIIYVDLERFTPLPSETALKISAGDQEYKYFRNLEQAKTQIIESDELSVLVCNGPVHELFDLEKLHQKKVHTVLVTDLPMADYSKSLMGQEEKIVRHVIANRPGANWTVHDLRITLQKLITNDIFGVSKYLIPNTQLQTVTITGSIDREKKNKTVMDYAASHNLGQHTCRSIYGITEELLMNAIYDAPVAAGRTRYNELPRSTTIELEPSEYSTLKYGFDGSTFAISVTDPFGAFKRDKLFQYVKKVLLRRDSENLIDNKKGGAGLGIFKILYSSHGFICNTDAGNKTEIISLIDTHHTLRDFAKMTRSIHYFDKA